MLAEAEVILKEGKYDNSKMHRGKKDEHISPSVLTKLVLKTSQELRMLSSVTINCQVTKIVMNSGPQLSVL